MRLSGFYLILFLTLAPFLAAQNRPRRDSVYEKIENFAIKRKSTKFLYRLLFRDHADTATIRTNTAKVAHPQYQGRHIRHIYITSLDPLGYDAQMQKKANVNKYENIANGLHANSRNFTIRGYLMFKKGEEFNAQKLYETERLLRTMNFVNRVSVLPIDSTATKDSIDIAVKVLDQWSLRPTASLSKRQLGLGLTEQNFLGLGHEVSLLYRTDFRTKQHYSMASYAANNIYGTFINAKLLGEKDMYGNENMFLRANREFFSPLTRWAGGVNLSYFRHFIQVPVSFDINPKLFPTADVKVHSHDIWGGYQFRVFNENLQNTTDNVALAGRFQNYLYMDAPSSALDPGQFFRSYNLFLGSLSYTQRKFKITKNVFQFLMPEDIPYGKSFSITGGAIKEFNAGSYPYLGFSATYGAFTKLGYFNYTAQYGSFFKNEKGYRSTFRVDGTYFSQLEDWKFAKARHFFAPTFVIGNSRNPSFVDRINISAPNEFPVYSPNYVGNDKLVLRYQLQLYVKKPWKNFSFSPYFLTALGWLSNDERSLFQSRINTKFGVGMMVYNPFLSINRFEISFVFYPKLPFDENNAYEINRYRSSQMPMSSFTAHEPGIVNYAN